MVLNPSSLEKAIDLANHFDRTFIILIFIFSLLLSLIYSLSLYYNNLLMSFLILNSFFIPAAEIYKIAKLTNGNLMW